MIPQLLERVRRAGALGDIVAKQDDALVLELEQGRLVRSAALRERGVNLRVLREGRSGVAGATDDDVEALVEAALAASEDGAPAEFSLPEPRPLPRVVTRIPRAAAAAADELRFLGQMVGDRLAADGRVVRVTVEQSVGSVRSANTAGLDAGYETSTLALLAEVAAPDELVVRGEVIQSDLPDGATLERLVERLRRTRRDGTEKFARTVKVGSGVQRMELEEPTTPELFAALWPLTRERRVRKRRYAVPEGSLTWEVDEFMDRTLVLAEVELPSAELQPQPPAWLAPYVVREVTDEAEYVNVNLARPDAGA
ncbi:MAG TPA: DNA gyrase modulator [Gemmatimonadales bacterium]|nr:DNA gyrase modulator [Gemmatimonadales bacterium]